MIRKQVTLFDEFTHQNILPVNNLAILVGGDCLSVAAVSFYDSKITW